MVTQNFFLALGYKSEVIKSYFYNYEITNSNFKINLKDKSLTHYEMGKKRLGCTLY